MHNKSTTPFPVALLETLAYHQGIVLNVRNQGVVIHVPHSGAADCQVGCCIGCSDHGQSLDFVQIVSAQENLRKWIRGIKHIDSRCHYS